MSKKKQHTTDNDKFQISIGFSSMRIDDEIVFVDELTNRYFRINGTGMEIFQQVISGMNIPTIVSHLKMGTSNVPDDIEAICKNFLTSLETAGILVRACDVKEDNL